MVNVIVGNDALLKCDIPSFVQDFISVDSWVSNEGTSILHGQFNSMFLALVLRNLVYKLVFKILELVFYLKYLIKKVPSNWQ